MQSRSDYGTKIKSNPKCDKVPRSTPTGLHYWSTRNETRQRTRSSSSSSLSLVASSAQSHRHLQAGFGSICESWGLSNLAPSRSRLFKLIGRIKGMRWSCSKRLAYMMANLFAKESEKRRQSTNEELWSRSDPITTYVKHNSNTMFTSRTPPRRDHHGYTHGWCNCDGLFSAESEKWTRCWSYA